MAATFIAGTNPLSTGVTAVRLGLAGFVLPFMFVYGPALLLVGNAQAIVGASITALIGVSALAAALVGHLAARMLWLERAGLAAGALTLVDTGKTSDVIGIGILAGVLAIHVARVRVASRRTDRDAT